MAVRILEAAAVHEAVILLRAGIGAAARGARPLGGRIDLGAIYGRQPLAVLETQGDLRIDGDRAFAGRFITLFPLPPKAGRPGQSAGSPTST